MPFAVPPVPPAYQGHAGRTLSASHPWWPEPPRPAAGTPNVLVVLFDDVGFSDFGCYGSDIATPTIDALAAAGVRCTGFHTTAMCSTTRAALLTGRNHHAVGMGCLANFDSGFPGYRGKIARDAATLAEMLRPHGYNNYMVGKWHVTPVSETGPGGPYDGWPLRRGFDRFYGFLDAETDQYSPELVQDNTLIAAPGSYESGYHLTEDLVDQTIRMIADHQADRPRQPWFSLLALGACHAPHQAPRALIDHYAERFTQGWDAERARRLARQIALGVVPPGTELPERNPGVPAWDQLPPEQRRLFTRLQAAYAAMLDHADQHLARLMAFLDAAGLREDTLVLVLSDNGASQEGGPLGMVNAMGPFNLLQETLATKLARIDDIGGPDTHSNFPHGWAMAANTPLKRYKQNTHGGGIRDPLVVAWPRGIAVRGALWNGFCHVSDLAPTVLDLLQLAPPAQVEGVPAQPMTGQSFAACLRDGAAPWQRGPQYFEMFGHRGIWHGGWKAVAWHAVNTPFENDQWELYHLDQDFSETRDLAAVHPARLEALKALWWREAEANQVLPMDDRFAPRFAENGRRVHGPRTRFVLHAGMGHLPNDVAPDVRSRDYLIEAHLRIDAADAEGVLVAHGDATCGYSLYLKDGRLVHDMNVGGRHHLITSERPFTPGHHVLGLRMRLGPWVKVQLPVMGLSIMPSTRTATLLMDGEEVGALDTRMLGFNSQVSFSGLDIGLDRGSPVSHYAAPFALRGARLFRVEYELDPLQRLDFEQLALVEMARQ
ncbi:MAG TPA: arylsulfatase [Pseudorhodoferax sp.]|nr:arylsulfatase [Pseudorhodoferax sp.]